MSKRQIVAALKAKGLECSTLEFGYQITPGETVGGWDVELTAESETKVTAADPVFDDWEPDCFNTADVLAWVATLPNVKGAKR